MLYGIFLCEPEELADFYFKLSAQEFPDKEANILGAFTSLEQARKRLPALAWFLRAVRSSK